MATPSEYYESVDITTVPVPDWSHLGVTSPTDNPTIKLPWDQIYIDDVENNSTKEEPHTPGEIEQLRLSFSESVKEDEYTPGITYRGKQYAQPWQLEYGFGRAEAFEDAQDRIYGQNKENKNKLSNTYPWTIDIGSYFPCLRRIFIIEFYKFS